MAEVTRVPIQPIRKGFGALFVETAKSKLSGNPAARGLWPAQ